MTHASLKKYHQTNKSTAQQASPYQLVAMLFQKLLGNIATAKGAISQNNFEKKGTELSNAIAIIGVLEGSLDFKQGGEVSENLASLYKYCSEQLLVASTNNDPDKLEEVIQILLPIKSGWDSIPVESQGKVSF
ncbi:MULTISPECIES: flagellar export chaperone FliS [unclassified Colwellia]|uniref:flagellar export chaperone FliS n=1 Tax=unclassified Colwellia TaxID=196834 RepID=UPI0015F5D7D0|nr:MULTISPECIES: flagellar export chaperone FliS [unclassified Colwellia]MBA6379048.1 flagellar export chaperone FliS [Colwellia sp. BRX10-7]MBA6382184.1 flagellar export chaperone FliS [Colwellia sp. BRX10-9]MBA6387230.1 flagellar export chaperone FliS [Colwellia sp. BRX10-2]MBA6394284.1 flagellar export chaperone FliS [Colwellia sp. BRX10-6]MBA6400103.1 flagellar export chaperone FliS [Colwellia sp. BRX10-5]